MTRRKNVDWHVAVVKALRKAKRRYMKKMGIPPSKERA